MIVATAAVLYSGYIAYSRKKRNAKRGIEEGDEILELLEGEREGLVHTASVTSITFYDGYIEKDLVENKVNAIVRANPWLDGRLVNIPTRGGVCCVYKKLEADSWKPQFKHFFTTSSSDLELALSGGGSGGPAYDKIIAQVEPLVVKKGTESVDKEESLFKVNLIELIPRKRYALVVSVSHVIGDGHTYYRLYGMLNETAKVFSLDPVRLHNFLTDVAVLQGPATIAWLKTPTTMIGFLFNMLGRRAPTMGVFELDTDGIQTKKSEFEAGVAAVTAAAAHSPNTKSKSNSGGSGKADFVSTNDIVSSEFFRMCESDYGMIVLNYRNRIPSYTDSHAGNYETCLIYPKDDCSDPGMIRESLTTHRSRSGQTPSMLESLNSNIAVTTNWVSLHRPIRFSTATERLHLPIIRLQDALFRDFLVIFRANADVIGLLYCGRKFKSAEEFQQAATAACIASKRLL